MFARRPIFEKHIIALVRAGERSIFSPISSQGFNILMIATSQTYVITKIYFLFCV